MPDPTCDQDVPTEHKGGANLRPDAAVRHGVGPLVQRGELPARSEFDLFRDVLDERRAAALAWVGGVTAASTFDRDDCEAYARWGTAADILFGVLQAEGLLTRTRRRKSLLDLWERVDKRASHYRELLRARHGEKDIGNMSAAEWLATTQERTPEGRQDDDQRSNDV